MLIEVINIICPYCNENRLEHHRYNLRWNRWWCGFCGLSIPDPQMVLLEEYDKVGCKLNDEKPLPTKIRKEKTWINLMLLNISITTPFEVMLNRKYKVKADKAAAQ